MDLTLSPSEEAFRDEVRSWLAANHPGEPPEDDDKEIGLVTMCCGGGLGTGTLIQRV